MLGLMVGRAHRKLRGKGGGTCICLFVGELNVAAGAEVGGHRGFKIAQVGFNSAGSL
jgi:hypothetical protein